MNLLKLFFLVVITSVSGCGGGSSDSGGSTPPPPVVVEVTVRYVGTQFIKVTAVGINVPPSSDEARFVLEVKGSRATIVDEDFTVSATIFGNEFTIVTPTLNIPIDASTNCSGEITYLGKVGPNITNGTITGIFDCGSITLLISGRFEAFPGAAKQLNSSLFDAIKTAF